MKQKQPQDMGANNPLAVMQEGEKVLCDLKRHPVGIFTTYAFAGVLLAALAVIAFVVLPGATNAVNRNKVMGYAALGYLVIAVFVVGFTYIASIIYWGNRWIVTSDSITQVLQTGLFQKQSSQLSLGNLEDVTVEQNGVLPRIFNYGTLKAETAGERSKFIFLFTPNPTQEAQKILAAREEFELGHRGGKVIPRPQSQVIQNNSGIDSYEIPS
jgi:uncharacterized membrane protein YdbT with pleckstrin-like domain